MAKHPVRTFRFPPKTALLDEQGNTIGEAVAIKLRLYDELVPAPDPAAPTPEDVAREQEQERQIELVWEKYVRLMKPRRQDLDRDNRVLIIDALTCASAEELLAAIYGCSKSDFHMGRDPASNGKKYNRLSNIIKGKRGGRSAREQIDFFLDIADKAPGGSRVTSADSARISRAKRDVLDMLEFPNDEHVVRRGEEGKAWLQERNWTVEVEDGSVIFRPPTH